MTIHIPFDNSYARLPAHFYQRRPPACVSAPGLIRINAPLARLLGIDPEAIATPEGLQILAGNEPPPGADPIALAYAGHQFGGFSPQLGDGRALLLGEVVALNGARYDIQLKGSGRTAYSRGGDGRAALGPVLREYLISEAMAALGIPTTRALAAVTTGDQVQRETPLPGAVLTRVAASHIRVGTFQFFAARQDNDALRHLTAYTIARHYPACATAQNPIAAFLAAVTANQATLIAQWLLVGFVHGVMNTDNTAISGETIDYGPCAFIDAYDPSAVFSSIDHAGRYAYGRQPSIAQWNLARLAETLLPLLADEEEAAIEQAQEALATFAPIFQSAYQTGLARKIGLSNPTEADQPLTQDLLRVMAENSADFTLTFRLLADAATNPAADAPLQALFTNPEAYTAWATTWRARLAAGPAPNPSAMREVNPAIIPRNHNVQAAIDAAVEHANLSPFENLLAALAHPYGPAPDAYTAPPGPNQGVYRTYCGT